MANNVSTASVVPKARPGHEWGQADARSDRKGRECSGTRTGPRRGGLTPDDAEGTVGGVHIRRRLLAEGPPAGGHRPPAPTPTPAPAGLVDRGAADRRRSRAALHHHRDDRRGTALREDRRPQLTQLIEDRREQVATSELRAARLRGEVEDETAALADSDGPIRDQRNRAAASRQAAGFTALRGTGVVVELDDAPRRPEQGLPEGASNDDLVVHQQDVQAVVNALWAGGAEAMSIMNVRVLATSAVRCVGNTLLLHGRVYSPPFKIVAIGDPAALQQALAASEGVRVFKGVVNDFHLGYRETVSTVTVPAFEDSTALRAAKVPR